MTIQNRVKRSFFTTQMNVVELKHQVQGHSCNASFSILVTDTFRPVYLYLDIMTSYTLSPFLLTRVQTGVRLWILFPCPLACCLLLLFFSHPVSVFS